MLHLRGVPGTHYNRVMEAPTDPVVTGGKTLMDVLGDVVVFVGFDPETVSAIINGESDRETIYRDLRNRLADMVNDGDINIDREYTVTLSLTLTGGVEHTVEARSEGEASDKARSLVEDGEWGDSDDFLNDANIYSIDVDHVELD